MEEFTIVKKDGAIHKLIHEQFLACKQEGKFHSPDCWPLENVCHYCGKRKQVYKRVADMVLISILPTITDIEYNALITWYGIDRVKKAEISPIYVTD